MSDTSFTLEDAEANLEMFLRISGFADVPHLLQPLSTIQYRTMREGLADIERKTLLNGFIKAFVEGSRKRAFALSEELTRRGIPPCFRQIEKTKTKFTLNQKLDLFLYDIRWIRSNHWRHIEQVRYQRYRDLFATHEQKFQNAAEFVFYHGKRPAWKIVSSLSLTEAQQWDCVWLRSAPISKRHAATLASGKQVRRSLDEELRLVRHTKTITGDAKRATLQRRHDLWVCSQMTKGSPTETAARYIQMTGDKITPDIAARQLTLVRNSLRNNETQTRAQSEQETL
ncbi:MAG: hypothetical protein K2Y28_06160 [Burkholderiaceae bacterium]|nr:hypothetical protein [Burkholderiaceae bacterium]